MFNWMRRRKQQAVASTNDLIASQPPGDIFPWPKGAVLTAVDELVLALPVALFVADRPMSEAVFGLDDKEAVSPGPPCPRGESWVFWAGKCFQAIIRQMPQPAKVRHFESAPAEAGEVLWMKGSIR